MSLDNTSTTKVEYVLSSSNYRTYQNIRESSPNLLASASTYLNGPNLHCLGKGEEIWVSTDHMY